MTPSAPPVRMRANLAGCLAILFWSLLALMTVGTGGIAPFQTAAISFAVGTLVGLVWIAAKRSKMAQPLPLKAVIFAALGLFAYHALYFSALKSAPAAEASLIAYLWPLFIVLGSAFLPGERLHWYHAAGALLGMIGCALLVTGGRLDSFEGAHFTGYALALCAA
ncbi:MAG: DMT family transporter, partial [Pseudomonadota bacterium]